MSVEYYLVPFGREPGGYLDMLGLPASAAASTVAAKGREYLANLKQKHTAETKALRERHERGEITTAEFDAEDEGLKTEHNERFGKFNSLRQSYTQRQNDDRGLENKGRKPIASGWSEMLRGLDCNAGEVGQVLRERGPLPRFDEGLLRQVEARWLRVPSSGDANRFPDLPSSKHRVGRTAGIAAVADLVMERDLVSLMWADALWARLRCTNRDHWRHEVLTWLAEIQALGPRLRGRPVSGASAPHDLTYPHLSQPPKRMIDRLDKGGAFQIPAKPERQEMSPQQLERELGIDLAAIDPDLLFELLKRRAVDADKPAET